MSRPSDARIADALVDPAVATGSATDAFAPTIRSGGSNADSPVLVLLSCFFVFAIFGIPLIFICRKFSPVMKVFWSAVVILYTLFLFACVGAILYWTWLQVSQAVA